MARCSATKPDGSQCRAMAIKGKDFCSFHDPDLSSVMEAGREAAHDTNRRRAEETRPAPTAIRPWRGLTKEVEVLESPPPVEVAVLVADTIDQVRTGEMTPQVGNSIGYLATILVKIRETVELEERLEAVEDFIRQQKIGG